MQRLTLLILIACAPVCLSANTVTYKKYVPGEGYKVTKRTVDGVVQKMDTPSKSVIKQEAEKATQVMQRVAQNKVSDSKIRDSAASSRKATQEEVVPQRMSPQASTVAREDIPVQKTSLDKLREEAMAKEWTAMNDPMPEAIELSPSEMRSMAAMDDMVEFDQADFSLSDDMLLADAGSIDRPVIALDEHAFNEIPLPSKEVPFRPIYAENEIEIVDQAQGVFPARDFAEARALARGESYQPEPAYLVARADEPEMYGSEDMYIVSHDEPKPAMSEAKNKVASDEKKNCFSVKGEDGWYIDLSEGAFYIQDQETDLPLQNVGTIRIKERWLPGITGSMRVGYEFENDLRTELEMGYYRNALDSLSVKTSGSYTVSGLSVRNQGLFGMLNVSYNLIEYDIHTLTLGVGAGFVQTWKTLKGTITNNSGPTSDTLSIRQQKTHIAYQALASYAIKLTDDFDFMARYRFFSYRPARFKAKDNISSEYKEPATLLHAVELGLRYWF